MKSFTIAILTLCLFQFSYSGVIKSPLLSDTAKEDFERDIRIETENFLNNIFISQIEFLNKLKTALKPECKRYQDIELYVTQLQTIKEEKELEKKDVMYWEAFKQFKESPLLSNEKSETGLTDAEFSNALTENGFKDMLKDFFADVAVYFWKMARASGKLVETTVDEYVEQIQKSKRLI